MTTDIEKSMEGAEAVAGAQLGNSFRDVKISARQRWNRATLRAVVVASMLGIGLALSAFSNYLFFKELLVATAIIGMAMLVQAARHPAIIIARDNDDRAHLN